MTPAARLKLKELAEKAFAAVRPNHQTIQTTKEHMSASKPTFEEIKYLASLDVVRSDGVDRTTPALAKSLMSAFDLLEECSGIFTDLSETCWNDDSDIQAHHFHGINERLDEFLELRRNNK